MELGLKVRPTTTVDRPNFGLMVSLLLNLNKEGYHRNNTYQESKRCKKDRLTGVPSLIYRACMVIEKENKLLLLLLLLLVLLSFLALRTGVILPRKNSNPVPITRPPFILY